MNKTSRDARSKRKSRDGRGRQSGSAKPLATRPVDPPSTPNAKAPPSRGRLALLLCALLLSGLALWWSGQLSALPRAWADQAIVQNRLEDAQGWYEWADTLSYRNYRNALLAARIARHAGDADTLTNQLERAELWGASQDQVERERSLALAQAGELDLVEDALFNRLAEGDPEPDEISEALANGLAATGRFQEAGSVIMAWRNDFPEDPRCDYRLGRIFEHQERYDNAEESYRDALGKYPRFYPAAFSLARVMRHQKRVEEAVAMFEFCLGMPHPAAAKIELAVALKSLGKGDEARALLREVLDVGLDEQMRSYASVEEQPEGFRAAAEYGRLETDAGNFQDALPWLEAALDANPLDLTVRYSYGVALRGLEKFEQAEKQFTRVREARDAMGVANALNERIKRDPADIEARYELGRLILENESERIGVYWLRSIFAHDPEYAPAHKFLADFYTKKARRSDVNAVEMRRRADYHREFVESAAYASPNSAP